MINLKIVATELDAETKEFKYHFEFLLQEYDRNKSLMLTLEKTIPEYYLKNPQLFLSDIFEKCRHFQFNPESDFEKELSPGPNKKIHEKRLLHNQRMPNNYYLLFVYLRTLQRHQLDLKALSKFFETIYNHCNQEALEKIKQEAGDWAVRCSSLDNEYLDFVENFCRTILEYLNENYLKNKTTGHKVALRSNHHFGEKISDSQDKSQEKQLKIFFNKSREFLVKTYFLSNEALNQFEKIKNKAGIFKKLMPDLEWPELIFDSVKS